MTTHNTTKNKSDIKVLTAEDSAADEKAAKELAQILSENSRFNFKLSNQYKVEILAAALAMNWDKWDEINRKTITGFLRSAYQHRLDIVKGYDVTSLRVLTASKILDIDPESSLRILVSIVTDVAKPTKTPEISPKLCKGIQSHFFDDEKNPRYEKLFLSNFAHESKIILQHIVAATFGQFYDPKDPALVSKQLQLLNILLEKNLFVTLEQPTIFTILDEMRVWPISILAEVEAIRDQFTAKFPNKVNPFASVIPAPKSDRDVKPQECQPSTIPTSQDQPEYSSAVVPEPKLIIQPAPTSEIRNIEDPREVISIVTVCLNKLEADLATKHQEIARLNSEKRRNDETREKKRAQFESLHEENRRLNEEISTLKSTISSKISMLQAVQNENDRLSSELSTNEQKTTSLVVKHEQAYEDLSNRLENISTSNINEFKRGLEIDLSREFNEIVHLPSDESCIFHKDLIDAIFRKLRDKGVNVGGGQ
jgi:hypothetical protein